MKAVAKRPNSAWYQFIILVTRNFFFQLKYGIRSLHSDRIPRSGPVIIAPNHLSNLDPPAVAVCAKRHMRFMAKEELFKGIFGWGIRSVGAFPVRRGQNDTESIRLALAILQSGQALLLFPEGTRGNGTTLLPMNKGVALLAKKSDAQVVPAIVLGTAKATRPAKRPRVTVAFGEPFRFSEVEGAEGKDAASAFSAHLESRLLTLAHEQGYDLKPSE